MLPQGPNGEVGLIDFGQTFSCDAKLQAAIAGIIVAVRDGDEHEQVRLLYEIGLRTKTMHDHPFEEV